MTNVYISNSRTVLKYSPELARRVMAGLPSLRVTYDEATAGEQISPDDAGNAAAEMFTWDDDPAECQRQFNKLIIVVRDADGDYEAVLAPQSRLVPGMLHP